MPLEETTTDASYYSVRNEYQCKPWGYTSWSTFTYKSLRRQYNSTQSRVKPDPLTDTALTLQFTQRIKPSVSGWSPWTKTTDYACNPARQVPRSVMTKGIMEYSPTLGAQNTDWSNKLLLYLSNQYVNIGSSLAEYRATAGQFSSYARSVRDAWLTWKGLKKGRARLTPCSIPAAELAYSFGIKPLTEDIYSAVEAFRLDLDDPIYVGFDQISAAHVTSKPTVSGYINCIRRTFTSDRCEGVVRLKPWNSGSFGFGNPATWAWELIPFSFVVDWAIPIGDWLAGIDVIKKIESVKGTRTRKVLYVSKWQRKNDYYNPPPIGSVGSLKYKSHERVLLTSVPVPTLPKWKPSATYKKLYRAVSLLISVNQPCRKYSRIRRAHSDRHDYTE